MFNEHIFCTHVQYKLVRIDCLKWHCWLRICTFKIVVDLDILPFIGDVWSRPSTSNASESLSPYILANAVFAILGLANLIDENWHHMVLNISYYEWALVTFHIFKNNLYFLYATFMSWHFMSLALFSTGLLTYFLIGRNSDYIKQISPLCIMFMSKISQLVYSCFVWFYCAKVFCIWNDEIYPSLLMFF